MPNLGEFFSEYGNLLTQGTVDTLAMLFISTGLAYVLRPAAYVRCRCSMRCWVGSST